MSTSYERKRKVQIKERDKIRSPPSFFVDFHSQESTIPTSLMTQGSLDISFGSERKIEINEKTFINDERQIKSSRDLLLKQTSKSPFTSIKRSCFSRQFTFCQNIEQQEKIEIEAIFKNDRRNKNYNQASIIKANLGDEPAILEL